MLKNIKIFFLFIFFTTPLLSQNILNTQSDTILFKDESYVYFKSNYIIDSIYSIIINNKIYPTPYFNFDRWYQKIFFPTDLKRDSVNILLIKYSTLPIRINSRYKRFELKLSLDTLKNEFLLKSSKSNFKIISDDIFSSDIQKSGIIYRGFSFGTNNDLSVKSGFRLQLAGYLTKDLELIAALTDENNPIQPEGTSKNIQDVDKVFIQLKHPNFDLTFGDFIYNIQSGEFSSQQRKLQGIKVSGIYENIAGSFSYASSKGKTNTQYFNGIDGIQGPYRLFGKLGERDIIILAGTEKVYINGELLTRGENYDYTIDYGTGEIVFTAKRIIRNEYRIAVDFEYSDRKYQRNFIGIGGSTNLFNNKLKLDLTYYRDEDLKDEPIDLLINDSDKKIIENAGNNRFKAIKSGIFFVGKDSMNKPLGQYVKKDTLGKDSISSFYFFEPTNDSAFYNITFSFVGNQSGDYIKESIGRFKFVGKNQGNYLPIILFPLPELLQNFNINSYFMLFDKLINSFEFSYSSFNPNAFSNDKGIFKNGIAYKYELSLDSLKLQLFNAYLGSIDLKYRERFLDSNYLPMQRINQVEFNRDWNYSSSFSENERLREGNFKYKLNEILRSELTIGALKSGNDFNSNKLAFNILLFPEHSINSKYSFFRLNSQNSFIKSQWDRHLIELKLNIFSFENSILYEFENKLENLISKDSLLASSFKFFEINDNFKFITTSLLNLNFVYSYRKEYTPLRNNLIQNNYSNTFQVQLITPEIIGFYNSLFLSYRSKIFYDEFKSLGALNQNNIAIKFNSKGNLLNQIFTTDILYEASSQYSSKLEKIFLKVTKGTGDYIYVGDKNNNNKNDESDFEYDKINGEYILTTYPTDQLFPVTDLKTNFRLNINLDKINENLHYFNFIKYLNTETTFRIDEISKDEITSNIYFLKLNHFLDSVNTINGTIYFQQDLFLFQKEQSFNLRIRFSERKSFNQFSLSNESRFQQEKSIRMNLKLIDEISNRTEYIFSINNLFNNYNSNRNYKLENNQIKTTFIYFPFKKVEFNFNIEYLNGVDNFPINKTDITLNKQGITFNYSLSDLGRILLSVDRVELKVNFPQNFLPFELTNGLSIGNNYIMRVNFDYKISKNIQTNAYYENRIRSNEKIIHNARAEIRAFF